MKGTLMKGSTFLILIAIGLSIAALFTTATALDGVAALVVIWGLFNIGFTQQVLEKLEKLEKKE